MREDIKEIDSTWAVAVGLVLRKARQQMQIVQDELGYRSNLTIQTLQRVENGKSNLSLQTLTRLCRVLNVTPSHVLALAQEFVDDPKKLAEALEARSKEPHPSRAKRPSAD